MKKIPLGVFLHYLYIKRISIITKIINIPIYKDEPTLSQKIVSATYRHGLHEAFLLGVFMKVFLQAH